jgi:transcription elongation factor Elf1
MKISSTPTKDDRSIFDFLETDKLPSSVRDLKKEFLCPQCIQYKQSERVFKSKIMGDITVCFQCWERLAGCSIQEGNRADSKHNRALETVDMMLDRVLRENGLK